MRRSLRDSVRRRLGVANSNPPLVTIDRDDITKLSPIEVDPETLDSLSLRPQRLEPRGYHDLGARRDIDVVAGEDGLVVVLAVVLGTCSADEVATGVGG
jgi:hypothetical protein